MQWKKALSSKDQSHARMHTSCDIYNSYGSSQPPLHTATSGVRKTYEKNQACEVHVIINYHLHSALTGDLPHKPMQ
jgi:hypothetical protein